MWRRNGAKRDGSAVNFSLRKALCAPFIKVQ
jgi:hypothetical protein